MSSDHGSRLAIVLVTTSLKAGSSTVSVSECRTIVSLAPVSSSKCSSMRSVPTWESGLLVKPLPSPVMGPLKVLPSTVTTTSRATQASNVRHGCRALVPASDWGENFDRRMMELLRNRKRIRERRSVRSRSRYCAFGGCFPRRKSGEFAVRVTRDISAASLSRQVRLSPSTPPDDLVRANSVFALWPHGIRKTPSVRHWCKQGMHRHEAVTPNDLERAGWPRPAGSGPHLPHRVRGHRHPHRRASHHQSRESPLGVAWTPHRHGHRRHPRPHQAVALG